MTRKFRVADYEKTPDLQISLRDVLAPDHLARFIVDVVAQLDLSAIYNHYRQFQNLNYPKINEILGEIGGILDTYFSGIAYSDQGAHGVVHLPKATASGIDAAQRALRTACHRRVVPHLAM